MPQITFFSVLERPGKNRNGVTITPFPLGQTRVRMTINFCILTPIKHLLTHQKFNEVTHNYLTNNLNQTIFQVMCEIGCDCFGPRYFSEGAQVPKNNTEVYIYTEVQTKLRDSAAQSRQIITNDRAMFCAFIIRAQLLLITTCVRDFMSADCACSLKTRIRCV